MNYILKPSLEHITLVKIAITLWNQDDIRALTARFYFRSLILSERRKEWQVVEDRVIEKIPGLLLPGPLEKKVLNFIKPIGLEILKWREYHDQNSYLGIDLPNELCWTSQGTVDQKKTAEVLIKDENLDITIRYRLACIYCLEDDIRELWNKIPENRRKSFYSEEDPRKVRQQELVVLWTYDIKGEVNKLDNMIERRWQSKCSPYQYAFEYAAVGGNKAAAEYFLQKLTSREREESLVRSAGYVANRRCNSSRNRTDLPKECYADVLCFLLSQMDKEQEAEVFKGYPRKVLKCFLDWPWQNLFMETANRMWDFLSEEDYNYFLRETVDKVIEGHKDYDYQKLFGELWQQSPNASQRYVIGKCASSGFLLSDLFKIEDEENVRLILNNATVKEKEEIIFYYKGKNICESLIYNNKWDSLKFFVQECISSKEVMIKFKEEFKERIIHRRSEEELEREKGMWNKFFQLLDDLAQENNKKRSMEEGGSSPAKRLCSIEFKEVAHSMKK
ncbi:hypothetical protein Wcon_00664 [Wolbachia endosymbiont of Cylisticus convexus]|uniref:hypothetical protein n=1 Tax=Wolbachia endosymbiont of Cylisticus convexus TaxID=118728 RepID=UPI000DF6C13B|nr:hypothetical protein [Wolbachia endosymbiont of Cylisticus convexus]RDD35197.1 hypothetical protein Wcon_00664 [Wolbachia endosymbiont of Cylisticus convexus]